LIPCAALLMLASCGGSGNQGNSQDGNQQAEEASAPKVNTPVCSDKEFFEGKDSLPRTIDLSMDISQMSYQRLRYMKAYLYCTKNVWMKDLDLNQFFIDRLNNYYDNVVGRFEANGLDSKETQMYWELWERDFDKALGLEKLSPEEQKFVDAINERMAKLEEQKYHGVNGYSLANPEVAVNTFQYPALYNKDCKFWKALTNSNVSFQTTNYEQLFNVYEHNSYVNMPNFVTTDLFLQAFHMYFAWNLKVMEMNSFRPTLDTFLKDVLQSGNYGSTCEEEEAYLDFARGFFAVAQKLINPEAKFSCPQQIMDNVDKEVALIMTAQDNISPMLGLKYNFNYSLFKPRGHYTRSEEFKQYFRTMMWLQTAAMSLDSDEFVKRAIAIAYVYNKLDNSQTSKLMSMYKALNYVMGEPDNVSVIEIANYIKTKHKDATLADCNDQYFGEIKDYVVDLFKKCNRIKPKEQNFSPDIINFMPQRYVFDNEVISNMYDEKPNCERAYPSGLDVFDALGVKSASAIQDTLRPENKKWDKYADTRKQMQDKFGNFDGWKLSNYNQWMKVLVDMQKIDKDYPDYMKTSVWDAKNLNAALASWAELKHDAILYAEQPMGAECGDGSVLPSPVPAGYVEPNLNFWNTLLEAMDDVVNTAENICEYEDIRYRYNNLKSMVEHCKSIAEKEIAHKPISNEDAWFIQTIGSTMEYFTLSVLDPDVVPEAWSFVKGADRSVAVVADVYTRNITDCEKQGILYEATGTPNQIFVLVEINGKLYITSGSTFSYHEFVRPMGDRLTDEQWQQMLEQKKAPAQPDWFAPLLLDETIEASETHCYSSGC